MNVTGATLIRGQWSPGTGPALHAVNPATGQSLPGDFHESGPEQVEVACRAAAEAAPAYRAVPREQRASFLEAIADEIDALGDVLTERVVAETALPQGRAAGERGRTVNQLRLFASVVRDGDYLGRRHDTALPDRQPLPRPDLRLTHVPVGPVAVFGASNFPLAFSVAGGDTASALAAGCPVVVKAHPAHPGVSELVAGAVQRAAERTGMPEGVFSMLHGGAEVGQALVVDPRIRAVGFTGSRGGGLALVEAGQRREVPIPVYAEMSSVNPVVVLPGALADPGALAREFAGSLVKEAGQYCTNPGLVFVPTGDDGDAFVDASAAELAQSPAQVMLTPAIAQACAQGVQAWRAVEGVEVVAAGEVTDATATPTLVTTDLDVFRREQGLSAEVFGPAGLVVRYPSVEELVDVLAGIEGQLTATVHGTVQDHDAAQRVLPVLEDRAGRVLWGGWPTGVEVATAMVHGGPFPATSAPATTSVGTLAIARFLRPVSYQNLPEELLPVELR
ncbi:aldehyde dehydrogenase (NADP(+)) [Knoellia sp. Soil729]|uniref:aldehyde dehydrogenase (NADP(+)) n=1 Tax=Knoellia sp. Soil729 TaxID=1736394 RepID=UPI0009EB6B76|nr:aldehyde dehydrogenase (NADP(+)) [Knoellia sp. Soil729]